MKQKVFILFAILILLLFSGLLISKASSGVVGFSQIISSPFALGNTSVYNIPEKITSLEINNLTISNITQMSALVSWNTSMEAIASMYWWVNVPPGTNISSKESALSSNALKTYHSYTIENLLPGHLYFLKISCIDKSNSTVTEAYREFSTQNTFDIIPPSDILSMEAIVQEKDIALRWINPTDSDFAGIIITRSTTTFPKDSQDGILVFKGLATSFNDADVVDNTTYYYLISTYDKAGNISKGAYLAVRYLKVQPSPVKNIINSPALPITPNIPAASGRIIEFWQNGTGFQMTNNSIAITRDTSLIINIPGEYVPSDISQLTLLLVNGSSTYSFIFPKDNRYNSYILTIPGDILNKNYEMTLLGKTGAGEVLQASFGAITVSKEETAPVAPKTLFARIVLYIIALWENIVGLFRG